MREQTKSKILYVVKKVILMLCVLVILSMVVFVIARLCPGDPLRSYYGDGVDHMSEEQKDAARESLGLNDSMISQYVSWGKNLLKGDLGISYKYKRPVGEIIKGFAGNTLLLGGVAYIGIFLFSILLGLYLAYHEDSVQDKIICKIGTVSSAIPTFFLALVLILIFAVNIKIFPSGGAYSIGNKEDVLDRIYHLILPAIVLIIEHLWYYTYMIRNKLLEETRKDYVLLCKAEGIPSKKILRKHCLRNIMPSLLVIMAISLPHILGGTYVVEMVFSYPGLGSLSFESARYEDYNMLMALCIITGVIVLVFNLIAQVISEFIDPRMAYEEEVRNV